MADEMINEPDLTLEPSSESLRRWTQQALDHIVRHLETLPEQNAGYCLEDALGPARALIEPDPPLEGQPLPELLDLIFNECAPRSFNTAGPGYLAYIPGGGLPQSALAEFIAASINRYTGVWVAAPMLVELEANVLRWFTRFMGMPETTRGLLTTGGSMANLTALVTARCEKLGDRFGDGVILVGDHVHHSVGKSARIAGFRKDQVRAVPSDGQHRLCADATARIMAEERAAGRRVFCIVASAGSTDTGAVDDLPGLARLCRSEDCWLHVDAAYGGFFNLTIKGKRVLRGIEDSDSITLDPHKGLFLPYGTGALLVRDGEALRRAHASEADYMPDFQDEDDDWQRLDFCEHGLELSRGYRGLRIWLPMKMHGIGPFVANLEEKLELTEHAARVLATIPGITVTAPPQLSIAAFRLVADALSDDEVDLLNEKLLQRILDRQRVWMTHTLLEGRFVIRICVTSFRTHRDRIDEALEIIREESALLLKEISS